MLSDTKFFLPVQTISDWCTLEDDTYESSSAPLWTEEWAMKLPPQNAMVITSADKPYPVIYANKKWSEYTGYPLKEIRGKSLSILQGRKTCQSRIRLLSEALEQRKPVEVSVVNYKRDGKAFLNHLTILPLWSEELGRISSFLGIMKPEDYTETFRFREHKFRPREFLEQNTTKHLIQDKEIFRAAEVGDLTKLVHLDNKSMALRNRQGQSVLHRAAIFGRKSVIHLLLGNNLVTKMALNVEDNQGLKPLDYALAHGHDEIAEMLRAHDRNLLLSSPKEYDTISNASSPSEESSIQDRDESEALAASPVQAQDKSLIWRNRMSAADSNGCIFQRSRSDDALLSRSHDPPIICQRVPGSSLRDRIRARRATIQSISILESLNPGEFKLESNENKSGSGVQESKFLTRLRPLREKRNSFHYDFGRAASDETPQKTSNLRSMFTRARSESPTSTLRDMASHIARRIAVVT
uniref:PAS domain-containing protein n=2 Tax=Guillardia theta TaxID=55529 RepID=A0A7S4JA69_GUITH|mmetsp:Transcript_14294/g.48891  ORF Transcript_14294/g.48891 Transcript_14294/m.48891 type:complete len:467 (+) Transcript_14294:142-1542(+)